MMPPCAFILRDCGDWKRFTGVRFRITRRHPALDQFLSDSGIRAIHAHFGTSAVDIAPSAERHGLPLIATFHGSDVTRYLVGRDPKAALYRARLRHVFRYSTLLIAVSGFIASELQRMGAPPCKIVVHHIGIPIPDPPVPRVDREGVLYVGRLLQSKGIFDLVRAMSRLSQPVRSTQLTVIGDGPAIGEVQDLASELGVKVRLLGYQPPHIVAQHMCNNAVFCMPSHSEGLGMVFLEAAAHQLPVVATKIGGIPEAVIDGQTGLLGEVGNITKIAASLSCLLANRLQARSMGVAGRRHVTEAFDISRQSRTLEELYSSVVKDGSHPR